ELLIVHIAAGEPALGGGQHEVYQRHWNRQIPSLHRVDLHASLPRQQSCAQIQIKRDKGKTDRCRYLNNSIAWMQTDLGGHVLHARGSLQGESGEQVQFATVQMDLPLAWRADAFGGVIDNKLLDGVDVDVIQGASCRHDGLDLQRQRHKGQQQSREDQQGQYGPPEYVVGSWRRHGGIQLFC